MAQKKNYNAVKLKVELNIMASDEMVERLNNGEGVEIALANCFKSNTRGVVTINHEVMKSSTEWGEIRDEVFEYQDQSKERI